MFFVFLSLNISGLWPPGHGFLHVLLLHLCRCQPGGDLAHSSRSGNKWCCALERTLQGVSVRYVLTSDSSGDFINIFVPHFPNSQNGQETYSNECI